MSFREIWDIERAVDQTIPHLFDSLDSVWTALTPPEFQKPKCRVESLSKKGAGTSQLAITEVTGLLQEVECAWEITLDFRVFTDANPDLHGSYRSFVRMQVAQLPALINGPIDLAGQPRPDKTFLKYHFLCSPMVSEGDSPIIKPEKDTFATVMTYRSVIAIHASAWAQLNQP